MNQKNSKRIVVLASGQGTNLQALINACDSQIIKASVTGLVTNKPNTLAIKKAKKAFIPVAVVEPKNFKNVSVWDNELTKATQVFQPNLIVLAGFLLKIGSHFLKTFPKTINLHPSLLPKYGGKGMFGHNVHKAVLASKDPYTGISIHWVNSQYDRGPLIRQKKIPIDKNETLASLIEKVKAAENQFLIETIKFILDKHLA